MPRTKSEPVDLRLRHDPALKRALRRLDILWPGDGDYHHGVAVFIAASWKVVRLVVPLDDVPNGFLTSDRRIYVERKTQLGYVQELRPYHGDGRGGLREHEPPMVEAVQRAIIAHIEKRKTIPNVLHINCGDLMTLATQRTKTSEMGDTWGLSISLVPRGEPLSVDRRIDL